MNIRSDLVGVVHAFRENGETVVLRAGDPVPSGIKLGSHLVEDAKTIPVPTPEPEPAPEPEQDDDPKPVVKPAPSRRGRSKSA